MTTEKHTLLERKLTPAGAEVHHVRYNSAALQRLYRRIGNKTVKVKIIDPSDSSRIQIWHPHDRVWFEVGLSSSPEGKHSHGIATRERFRSIN